MATPKKNTVDYFPHIIGHGKKMDYIEKRYGNDGYAIWFKILEALASADNHYLDLNDEIEFSFLSARCNVSEHRLIDVIQDLVKIKVFDKILWENRVIWCKSFVDSIQDAYKRRSTRCMQYDDVIKELNNNGHQIVHIMHTSCIHNDNNNTKNDDICPQSKVKESKVKESRGEETKQKSENSTTTPPLNLEKKSSEVIEELKSEKFGEWRNLMAMNYGFDSVDLLAKLEEFGKHLGEQGHTTKTVKDCQQHFANWMRKTAEKKSEAKAQTDVILNPETPPDQSGRWVWSHRGKRWQNRSEIHPGKMKEILRYNEEYEKRLKQAQ